MADLSVAGILMLLIAQTQHGKLMFVMVNPVQWKAWVVSVQESGRGEGLQMNDDGNEG